MPAERLNWKSKVFFAVFFLAILASVGLTYYHTVVLKDYVVFTDPDNVPDPADWFGDIANFFVPSESQ